MIMNNKKSVYRLGRRNARIVFPPDSKQLAFNLRKFVDDTSLTKIL